MGIVECCEPGCGNKAKAQYYCSKHYMIKYRAGLLSSPKSFSERFWDKVSKSDHCWIWTGAIAGKGYGHMWDPDRKSMQYAHRIAWELLVGPIGNDMTIDHDNPDYGCGNKLCVNVDHLECVSLSLNSQRGSRKWWDKWT